MDPEEELKTILSDAGEVGPLYGGFEIKVSKPTLFPWYRVIRLLIEIGQKVWIEEKEGQIYIISEPKVR